MLNPWRIDRSEESEGDETERLTDLKLLIALEGYEVDAARVADEVLAKLRLVRRGRLAISADAADRIRRPPQGRLQHP
jgi:hypothetical protein